MLACKQTDTDFAYYNYSNGTKEKAYSYEYDAWGNFFVIYHNGGAATPATNNPLTYRGYYYDSDLNLYYLNARYYDSRVCRFINVDGSLYHSMLGYNMFVYCNNNPVNFVDYSGEVAVAIGAGLYALGAAFFKALFVTAAATTVVVVTVEVTEEIVDYIGETNESNPASNSKTETPPQSIEVPDDTTEKEESVAVPNKDSRFYGKPGQINKEGTKETYIGPNGKAEKERHWSNHGNPKKHTIPHDHDISWNEKGNPELSPPNNYWDGNIPIFP